jgi:hypothetical protein
MKISLFLASYTIKIYRCMNYIQQHTQPYNTYYYWKHFKNNKNITGDGKDFLETSSKSTKEKQNPMSRNYRKMGFTTFYF